MAQLKIESLSIFRIFYYTAQLFWLCKRAFAIRTGFPEDALPSNVVFSVVLPQPSWELGLWLHILAGLLCVFAILGLGTYVTRIFLCALTVYLYGYPYGYGTLLEFEAPLALMNFILIFAPLNDAYSLDQNWFRFREPLAAAGYTWPITAVRMFWIWFCGSAGLLKLRGSGLEWITGDALREVLANHITNYWSPVTSAFLLKHPALTLGASASTVLVETLMFVGLVSYRWLAINTLLMVSFMAAVAWVMPYRFFYSTAPLYIAVLPWEKIAAYVRSRRTKLAL